MRWQYCASVETNHWCFTSSLTCLLLSSKANSLIGYLIFILLMTIEAFFFTVYLYLRSYFWPLFKKSTEFIRVVHKRFDTMSSLGVWNAASSWSIKRTVCMCLPGLTKHSVIHTQFLLLQMRPHPPTPTLRTRNHFYNCISVCFYF